MASTSFSKGLAGVVAGETAISTVGQAGKGLSYRGYDIADLADHTCFEEVAFLLLYNHLPNADELRAYIARLAQYRRVIPSPMKRLLETIPRDAHPMDVMRTACSALGTMEPESQKPTDPNQKFAQWNVADRLIASFGPMLLYWYHFHFGNGGTRLDTSVGNNTDSIARNFIRLLRNDGTEPDDEIVRAVDVSLILYAEHELAASTFATRITTSTMSDIYSAITSAIGTLRGPLHGGANEAAFHLISRFNTPDEAEAGVLEMLRKKQLIMGFGHRVYRKGDPRTAIIKSWAKRLSERPDCRQRHLFAVAERIEEVMWRERKIFPNLDFYASIVYHLCGIPVNFFTPVFVISRCSGWASHVFEQRADNRLIRPSAIYVGPESRPVIPIEKRPLQSRL